MYKKPTFDSFAFGCRVNEAEKLEIDRQMDALGYAQSEADPDIYIINTCSVTKKAEREARQLILKLKSSNPHLKLVVTGCSATYWRKNGLYSKLPIDLLIENINKTYTARLIHKRFSSDCPQISPTSPEPLIMDKFLSSGRLMIKIQDGCHRFCTYCIVPYLRGTPHSIKVIDLLTTIETYDSKNIKEVIYTAINTEAFGHDTKETLVELINASISKTKIPRISFGSIHPWSINPELIACYEHNIKSKRLSNFFHIPLQSSSDKMLQLMKRGYKANEIQERLIRLSRIFPNTPTSPKTLIATDIIVGFLEETDKDFEDTYQFLEKSPISKVHVFRFSSRQNTAADYMKKKLREPTDAEKKRRAKALIELSFQKFSSFQNKNVGVVSNGLFIGRITDGYQTAIMLNQLQVQIPVKKSLRGTMKRVTITEFKKGKLIGKFT